MKQENTLLIGVGGTGCKVVRELKKKMHAEWRHRGAQDKQIPDTFEFKGTPGGEPVISRIATLSIDSNKGDLAGEGSRDKWLSLGEDIRLTESEQVLIDSSAVPNVAQNFQSNPGISPWLRKDNEKKFLTNIMTGLAPGAGCNQLRRLGRLALASGNNISKLTTGVTRRLNELCKNNGQSEVDIHIAGSLATGTGGGTMLDIVAQLQAYLTTQPWEYRLYIHTFTTSADVGAAAGGGGRFYPNQYAALKEYNAFNRSLYKPWDINNPSAPKQLSIKPVELDPNDNSKHYDLKQTFKSLFMITETTDSGTRVSLDQQIDSTADLLFQLAIRQLGDVPDKVRKALSNEDNAETTDEGFTGVRSLKFASYGVHRIVIPEMKIRQKLAINIALPFTQRLLYNNWAKTYQNEPMPFSSESFVGAMVRAWEVLKSYLWQDNTVGKTCYPEEKEFKNYQTTWKSQLENFASAIKKKKATYKEMQDWIREFNKEAEHYWDDEFRKIGDRGGVERYFSYHGSSDELEKRAKRACAHIEADLLENMENGTENYALDNLPETVDKLIKRIEEECTDFKKRGPGYEKLAQASEKRRNEIRDQFGKIGRITRALTGMAERLFGQYQTESEIFYTNRTYARAAQYAAVFCPHLLEKLRQLRKQVGEFKRNIATLRDNYLIEKETPPKKENGVEDYVDWQEIDTAIENYFVTDRVNLNILFTTILEEMKVLRGKRLAFQAYNEAMKIEEKTSRLLGGLPDIVRRLSLQYTPAFHKHVEDTAKQNNIPFKPFFGRNIIKELFEEYREVTPALRDILAGWMNQSSPMVSFDSGQPRVGRAILNPGPNKRRQFLLPTCQEVTSKGSFREDLQTAAQGLLGNNDGDMIIKDMAEDQCPNEICIMTVAFYFPARWARVVGALKNAYDKFIQDPELGAFNYYQVHSESIPFPDLMKPNRTEALDNQLPWILTATALGFMHLPDTMERPVYFGTRSDELSPIDNKIETGLTLLQDHKDHCRQVNEQYNAEVSLELELLYSSYTEKFLEESCTRVEELVSQKIDRTGKKLDKNGIDQAEAKLDALKKEVFLLAHRNEEDTRYNKYIQAIEKAKNTVIPLLRVQR